MEYVNPSRSLNIKGIYQLPDWMAMDEGKPKLVHGNHLICEKILLWLYQPKL
jgi:hypothetical protein